MDRIRYIIKASTSRSNLGKVKALCLKAWNEDEGLLEDLKTEGARLHLATVKRTPKGESELIGYGGTVPCKYGSYLLDLVIAPEFRRSGVAQVLFKAMLDNCPKPWVAHVEETNEAILQLIAKFGIVPCVRLPLYYGLDSDAFLVSDSPINPKLFLLD